MLGPSYKFKVESEGQRGSGGVTVLALHANNPRSIPGTAHGTSESCQERALSPGPGARPEESCALIGARGELFFTVRIPLGAGVSCHPGKCGCVQPTPESPSPAPGSGVGCIAPGGCKEGGEEGAPGGGGGASS